MNRAELREQIRRNADMVNSQFVSDAEINALIDMTTRQLYDVLVAQYGDDYFSAVQWIGVNSLNESEVGAYVPFPNLTFGSSLVTSFTPLGDAQILPANIPAVGVYIPFGGCKSSFLLAADFLRLVRAEFVKGTVTVDTVSVVNGPSSDIRYGNQYNVNSRDTYSIPMRRIDTPGQVQERMPRDWTQGSVAYRLRSGPFRIISRNSELGPWGEGTFNGTVIEFLPPTKQQYAVQLTYVPKARLLPSDTEQFAYQFPEFVIHGCAAYCLEKERSDSSVQRALQQAVKESITSESRTMDAANAPMVSDVGGFGMPRSVNTGEPRW